MMTQIDELTNNRHLHMSYDEFIEAVARVADKCNLLLVSSEYFGVDLDEAVNLKAKVSRFKEAQQTLVPETSNKGVFNPANVLKAQKVDKVEMEEVFSEVSSNSDSDKFVEGKIRYCHYLVSNFEESKIEPRTQSDKSKISVINFHSCCS